MHDIDVGIAVNCTMSALTDGAYWLSYCNVERERLRNHHGQKRRGHNPNINGFNEMVIE